MIRLTISSIINIAVVCFLSASARQDTYRNQEYGITMPTPVGALLCLPPGNEHDHGPVFLLGNRNPSECRNSDNRGRYIDIFASGNAVVRTKTLDGFLKYWACNGQRSPCTSAPGDLKISGLSSLAARVNHPSGWIDISVVTQAGKPDPAFDPTVPSINYILGLHTNQEHYDEDLRVFRQMLKTIKLSPPD